MKIISDKSGYTVEHKRVILIENGPLIDAGALIWAGHYKPGTRMRVEVVQVFWQNDDTDNTRIRVTGHRINKGGHISTIPHEVNLYDARHVPGWLEEILALPTEES